MSDHQKSDLWGVLRETLEHIQSNVLVDWGSFMKISFFFFNFQAEIVEDSDHSEDDVKTEISITDNLESVSFKS